MRRLAPLIFLLASCRSPEPAARADDAACNCPSTEPKHVEAASVVAPIALPLDSPEPTGASTQTVLVVDIAASGAISVNGKPAVLADVSRLAGAALLSSRDVRSVISADRKALHGDVIAVLDALRSGGITKVAFAVSK